VLGYGQSVDEALAATIRQMIDWLSQATGLPGPDIYALASIAGSFRITQYANQKGSVYTPIRR
jgi:acetamidase/formamidase